MVYQQSLEIERPLDRVLRLIRTRTLWTGNQLCEYMARYLYVPRLRDDQVLIGAIQDGVSNVVWSETFAFAERWEEQRQRYGRLQGRGRSRNSSRTPRRRRRQARPRCDRELPDAEIHDYGFEQE